MAKGKNWQPRPSTMQSGVLNYSTLQAKKRRLRGKKRKIRTRVRELLRLKDAIRQEVDRDNRVNFEAVGQLLARNPRMSLREAKRLAYNI